MSGPILLAPTHASLVSSGISKSFGSGQVIQTVIQNSSLNVFPGELTLVVGPSGSGKSTMLAMMSGLLRPDTGHVHALGIDLWTLNNTAIDRFRLENCGFIFQGFNLFGALTALENVLFPLQHLGFTSAKALEMAKQALDEVGLSKRAHLRPTELSGGEKQRVAIARAVVKNPKLMFADEPTSALDGVNGQIVIDLLKRIAHTHGATVLGVTHDPRLYSHADRVVTLEDGIITKDERVSEHRNKTEMHP
jgi:putative ABC transport system ATP-binding protein